MILPRHILVATDFSEPSEAALAYGRDFARTFDATLHVLHVADNMMSRYAGEASMMFLPQLQSELEAAARARLDTIISDEDRTMLHAVPVVMTSVAAADAIVTYAAEHQIDLIILGTHGRRALAHVLMGSVAERVVRFAPCPVLTVRHPEREFLRPDALVAVSKAS